MDDTINIALPKGRLASITINILKELGLLNVDIPENSRKLIFTDEKNKSKILFIKPTDVPTYVESGIADIGIAGKDILEEYPKNLFEPLDLKFGYCRLSIAAPSKDFSYNRPLLTIGTKFPNITKKFFLQNGGDIEIIKLYGAVELAPIVGLSDCIVDLVSSGDTLKENGLYEIETIMESTARLIVNKAALKIKQAAIKKIIRELEAYVKNTSF